MTVARDGGYVPVPRPSSPSQLLVWPASRAIFSITMPSSDSSGTNVCRRSRGAQSLPTPARSQTSWNIFRMCLAPSGVPVAVVNTLPVSCQRDPAASRSLAPRRPYGPASARDGTSGSWCLLRSDPRAAPRPTEDCRPDWRPAPTRSPGLPRGARQPSGSPECRHASARPDAADPSGLPCRSSAGGPAVGARRVLVVEGDAAMAAGHPSPSGSMHRWFPAMVTGPPISVSKRPPSCKNWWAQLGSNQ